MSRAKDEAGWVNSLPLAPVDDVDADQPTRIAPASHFEDLKLDSKDQPLDATVIRSNRGTKQTPKTRSAEFLPPSGHRATGEVTLSWSPTNRFDVKALRPRLVSLGKAVLSRRVLVLLVALTVIVGAVAMGFVGTQDAKESRDKGKTHPAAERIETVVSGEGVPPTPDAAHEEMEDTDSLESEPVHAGSHTLKAAADALIDGQLDEALRIYRELEDRFPRDESYSLAVEILSRSRKERLK
ncbi:MAG: hypothetical protein GY854_05310 [Deltaproteobacteria bacterium]|nr:hypothetical protein [Deltaproteobacteria bacterium]